MRDMTFRFIPKRKSSCANSENRNSISCLKLNDMHIPNSTKKFTFNWNYHTTTTHTQWRTKRQCNNEMISTNLLQITRNECHMQVIVEHTPTYLHTWTHTYMQTNIYTHAVSSNLAAHSCSTSHRSHINNKIRVSQKSPKLPTYEYAVKLTKFRYICMYDWQQQRN